MPNIQTKPPLQETPSQAETAASSAAPAPSSSHARQTATRPRVMSPLLSRVRAGVTRLSCRSAACQIRQTPPCGAPPCGGGRCPGAGPRLWVRHPCVSHQRVSEGGIGGFESRLAPPLRKGGAGSSTSVSRCRGRMQGSILVMPLVIDLKQAPQQARRAPATAPWARAAILCDGG